jgi:hypothetical protein
MGHHLQSVMIRHEKEEPMLRWMYDSLSFLFWFGVLMSARLLAVLLWVAEIGIVVTLWLLTVRHWQAHDQSSVVVLALAATLFVAVQAALWQYTWLRIAQRGGHWRAVAECFASVVRYPVVRTPHPWE